MSSQNHKRPAGDEVRAQNDRMRAEAAAEVAAGSTCPVPAATAAMTDEEFAEWDEEIVRANLTPWREAGMSEQEIEAGFRSPGTRAAYHRIRDADDGKVADSMGPRSLQPRVPVLERVAEVLATSGRNEAEVIVGFTYRALAARVYDVDEPTPAQLSAVRRVVAKLVASGRAERRERVTSLDHRWLSWLVDLPPKRHERRGKYGDTYRYANPGGVCIARTPTAEDEAARAAWEAKNPPRL